RLTSNFQRYVPPWKRTRQETQPAACLLAKPTQLNINRSSDRFAMFNKQRDITMGHWNLNNSARYFTSSSRNLSPRRWYNWRTFIFGPFAWADTTLATSP